LVVLAVLAVLVVLVGRRRLHVLFASHDAREPTVLVEDP